MMWELIAMKSREMTILAIALGAWMAWRLVGSTLLPVDSQEIGIAIIVLFKPWLDSSGWISLLTINAISYLPKWYISWLWLSSMFNERWTETLGEMGLLSEGYLSNFNMEWALGISWLINFFSIYFIWPYIWERAYLKAGVWGKLKWEK